ncbi:MAG: hypothetical protein GX624_01875 [Actinobacteria bacterium]|nr:hypothetical protein [Actinomycetota bacterium]
MEHLTYDIRCGDFMSAGAASRDLKQHLKRIGAESDAVRRAMIAAYEAEMNVVIHAEGAGRLEAAVSDGQLDVDVVDHGPGIADVASAMREGWSTASAEARALGFGAGMGLPNILRNSDRLSVTSTPGAGTRVSFSVALRPEAADQGARPSSLDMVAERCTECRHCLVACPTAAIRVRDARPAVLHHLCIDCTACIGACAPRALTMTDAPGALAGGDVLVVPPALLAGFGEQPVGVVVEELRGLGYDEVVSVHRYEDALRRAVLDMSVTGDAPTPLVSPVCPAVVNLVEVKFPSLIDHLAPLASPWEAAQQELDGRAATFAVSCPSQRTALLAQRPTAQRDTVTAGAVREAVLPRLAARAPHTAGVSAAPPQAGGADDLLVVTGVPHVLAVLEAVEDGRLPGVVAVEPYLCDGGCFGSPLLAEDAHVAAWRWSAVGGAAPGDGRSHERARPYRARPGIRLDADMAVAISKLAQLDAETKALPGRDCGVCGAPTCAALAEDIVMARATRTFCPYVTPEEEGAT